MKRHKVKKFWQHRQNIPFCTIKKHPQKGTLTLIRDKAFYPYPTKNQTYPPSQSPKHS